ncbi:Hsp70 family protein [filamentous cyanobacterium LEGE 11480]|uniref:Hsp70 family protein n=1 Tax=Romeriopsis navalis LEGE 11480 TaxID=2777977 RepID=A0A928VR65_9CYAN|nr:Hsp70 family protein [Romeriopsis navalis]MBE9031042.1 Hsp70 family protein [Romeriopsis navalis LEGE 11480]
MTTIAIDFGTSNTIVAYIDPQTQLPLTMQFDGISHLSERQAQAVATIPSQLFIGQTEIIVGETVRRQRLGFTQPERYFTTFKRDLVADFQPPDRVIDGKPYPIAQVAELFLTALWQRVLAQVQPTKVILTVPTGAFEPYVTWYRTVAERLELPLPVWVDESTAAALGYAVQRPGSRCLVVDCGGGTLDLSLVRTHEVNPGTATFVQAEVLAKSDAYIGGVDIDIWMVEDYLRRNGLSRSRLSQVSWLTLLELAERLKIRLSQEAEVKDIWFDDEALMAYELSFDQAQFEAILEANQFLERLRQTIDEVLTAAFEKGIQKADIEQVLLVGGSCQIPAVQQLLVAYFGRSRVRLDKPLEAVAHGALALTQIATVSDELRHSYAIRLWEPYSRTYTYFPLFDQGTRYPHQRAEALTLQVAIEGQTELRLDIGELANTFEAEVAYDSAGRMVSSQMNRDATFRSLSRNQDEICLARLDPPGQLGIDRLVVQFEVTAERILVATVRDLLTQRVLVQDQAVAKLV